jgi:tripartite-type tricarboxylate transporter receptor subunit TctC
MSQSSPLRRRATIHSVFSLSLALGIAGLFSAPVEVAAQTADYPTRPIRVVVPFGAGTTTDTITRVLAEAMSRTLGQPLVVENRAGGGGTIGSDQVAKSTADGYTLVMGTVGTHAINKTLFRTLPYDPVRDFAPLAAVGQTPTLLVVAANSPFGSLKDLSAAAAKVPGVSFASAGNGSSGHLAGELLKARLGGAGGQMVHVPYKEGGQALTDVMSGQAQFMFYHPAAVMPHIKAGKLRALGVSSSQRSAAAPEVPTIAEQGHAPFDLVAWFMLYAPAATPAPVLSRLRAAAATALNNPEVAARLVSLGVEKSPMPLSELEAFSQREIAKWGELVRQSGAQVD